MATREQVREAMHRQPFLGFTVRLTDGRTFDVRHRDFISIPETDRGRNLVIHDRGMHLIDILHVRDCEWPMIAHAAVTTGRNSGNQRSLVTQLIAPTRAKFDNIYFRTLPRLPRFAGQIVASDRARG